MAKPLFGGFTNTFDDVDIRKPDLAAAFSTSLPVPVDEYRNQQ
jgi:hypothetical protein